MNAREAGSRPRSAGRAREAGSLPWSAGRARGSDSTRETFTALVLLLDRAAPSFCYYQARGRTPTRSAQLAPDLFQAALAVADAQGLALQLVGSAAGIPADYRARLEGRQHAVYLPLAAAGLEPTDVVVVDLDDGADPDIGPLICPGLRRPVAVLRVARRAIERWPALFERMVERVDRVVLVLLELERWQEADLARHRQALERAGALLEREYLAGRMVQLSAISDRLALRGPAECAAGLDHLTLDPDGGLHLCPGFAVDGTLPLGQLEQVERLRIPNRQLLERRCAPICAVCDAFHCRRCVHLNQRATLEINTPAWQTCRAAHLEREASRLLLERMQRAGQLRHLAQIAGVDYEEPFERLTGRRMSGATRQAPTARAATNEIAKEARPMDTDRKPVGLVTPAERDQIRELYMRKTALTELFLSLSKLDRAALDASPLYEKVVRDMGQVTVRFQAWWDDRATAYGWPARAGGSWNINFETCEIYLD